MIQNKSVISSREDTTNMEINDQILDLLTRIDKSNQIITQLLVKVLKSMPERPNTNGSGH